MYLEFYGLKEKPFNILPDPDFFYLSQWHQQAITHIEYGLMNGDSLILLTGDAGTGKTSIIYKLVIDRCEDTLVGVIFNSGVDGDHIVEMILTELEVELPEKPTPASCLDTLQSFLLETYTKGEKKVMLILDEAQNLSDGALEQVRMISNLQAGKDNLISILMVGQSGFRARLRKAKYSQIVQRIVVSAHLSRLREQEVVEYVYYRLRQGGAEDPQTIIPDSAVKKITEYSYGIPRNINVLCEGSLIYGFADDIKPVTAELVEGFARERIEEGLLTAPESTERYDSEDLGEYVEGLQNRVASLEASMGIVKRTLIKIVKTLKRIAAQK
ncbi:ExeA family protein [Maridesulfovibrio hydrothermalis]|uniref:AAA ATPase n=1 Tax=Maridesulfovibrio hydrothermalis AM13 = DSM 14728 TaxID=1121451 RepID=L0RGW2_9BACT|nr:AAA family ATPase [Maridesulfovibrio hydrothermalis]CCO24826.1 AAA ATPase [Maridesulfovibrio hydrothermalis AM13 = DSM 14728]